MMTFHSPRYSHFNVLFWRLHWRYSISDYAPPSRHYQTFHTRRLLYFATPLLLGAGCQLRSRCRLPTTRAHFAATVEEAPPTATVTPARGLRYRFAIRGRRPASHFGISPVQRRVFALAPMRCPSCRFSICAAELNGFSARGLAEMLPA